MIESEIYVEPDFKTIYSLEETPSTVNETMFPAVEPSLKLIAEKVKSKLFS